MKKHFLWLMLLVAALWACNNDMEVNESGADVNEESPAVKAELVNPDFIKLEDDSTQLAGSLVFTGQGENAIVRWNITPNSNLDTTQTVVPLIDGKGKLPIKWREKLKEGTYGPLGTAFNSGVTITTDGETRYVPVIWAAAIDTVKFKERMLVQTRALDEGVTPKASEMKFFPTTLNLSTAMGGQATLLLKNSNLVYIDYSNILTGDNIDLTNENNTPISIEDGLSKKLIFKWAPSAPSRGFSRVITATNDDYVVAELTLSYKLQQEPELIVDADTIRVNAKGGNKIATVNVSTSQYPWTGTSTGDWLHPDVLTGTAGITTVTLSVDENKTNGQRLASIDLDADNGNLHQRVVVVQEASVSDLTLTPESVELETAGGAKIASIVVTTNLDSWTATSSSPWLTVSPTSGIAGSNSIAITAKENTTGAARTATITVVAGNVTKTVTVTQKGTDASLVIEKETVDLIGAGGINLSPMNIITNQSKWTAVSGAAWLSVNPQTGGKGTTVMSFTAEPNTGSAKRTATVVITAGSITKTITVNQELLNPSLTVSTTAIRADVNGGDLAATISSNISWQASSNQTWLKVGVKSGEAGNNISLGLSADAYTETVQRTATVTITAGSLTKTIVVTQDAFVPTLSVSASTLTVAVGGGTITATVSSNTEWQASSNQSWLTIGKSSGEAGDNISLGLSANANTGIEQRTATVTVTAGGLTKTVVVTQDGIVPTLTISTNEVEIDAKGGSGSLQISTNVDWTASCDQSWVNISKTSGTAGNNISVTLSVTTGSSNVVRYANVTFTAGGLTKTVVVTQAGFYVTLEAHPANVNVGANGGAIKCEINSNANWIAASNQPWLTVGNKSGSVGMLQSLGLSATANTGDSRTATVTITNGNYTITVKVVQAGITQSTNPGNVTIEDLDNQQTGEVNGGQL